MLVGHGEGLKIGDVINYLAVSLQSFELTFVLVLFFAAATWPVATCVLNWMTDVILLDEMIMIQTKRAISCEPPPTNGPSYW